jgi:hypothetical protein
MSRERRRHVGRLVRQLEPLGTRRPVVVLATHRTHDVAPHPHQPPQHSQPLNAHVPCPTKHSTEAARRAEQRCRSGRSLRARLCVPPSSCQPQLHESRHLNAGLIVQPMSRWASAVRALGAATVTPGVNGARAAAGCGMRPSFGAVGVRGFAGQAAEAAAAAATTTTRRSFVRHAKPGDMRFAPRAAPEGPVTALLKARTFPAAEAVLSAEGLNSRQVRACPRSCHSACVRQHQTPIESAWPACARQRMRTGH